MILELLIRASLTLLLAGQSQPPVQIVNPTNPNPMPSDARMMQFEWPDGAMWRVFGVDAYPDGPVKIVKVSEVRQQNPPSTWSVHVTSRALMPVNSVILAAAVVDINGKVKATQPLAAIKNLKPQQVIRKEIPVRVTVLAPTDRVVFFVKEIKSETGDWKSVRCRGRRADQGRGAPTPGPVIV
ncbi:MAG TPA: hypothetical protein VL919_14005 [Vicinamibacterales bacterium]|nr:hypothetical protein [Vicinamibacterales bacterium]